MHACVCVCVCVCVCNSSISSAPRVTICKLTSLVSLCPRVLIYPWAATLVCMYKVGPSLAVYNYYTHTHTHVSDMQYICSKIASDCLRLPALRVVISIYVVISWRLSVAAFAACAAGWLYQ